MLVCGGIGHMAYGIAHFSCCRSLLPDLPPTHPSSFLEFFPEVSFFPIPVCCGEIYLYSVFELLQFSNYFFWTSFFVLL